MKHLKYVGDVDELKSQNALVRDDPESGSRMVLVQFDSTWLTYQGNRMGFNWHSFYSYEFEEIK